MFRLNRLNWMVVVTASPIERRRPNTLRTGNDVISEKVGWSVTFGEESFF
jgi:hypothetical protein